MGRIYADFDSFAIFGLEGIRFVEHFLLKEFFYWKGGRFAWFFLTTKDAMKVAKGTKTLRFFVSHGRHRRDASLGFF
jgi:hypothetical protein